MKRSDNRKSPNGSQLELWGAEPIRTSQEELNLVEWPFATLSDKPRAGVQAMTFEDTIRTGDGKTLKRSWTLVAPATGVLPTATDESVSLAIQEITKERGLVGDIVPFTRNDLCKRLGWSTGGKDYQRLDDSLNRLAGVTIVAKNAFWDRSGRVYRSLTFHIFDELAIGDGRKESGGESPVCYIRWSNVMWESISARNLKSVDMDFYLSLSSALTRRLYRYLDRKRHDNETFPIYLRKLCWEHLGMSRNYNDSTLRRNLKLANDDLAARGFLLSAEFGTAANGEPKVTYTFAERATKTIDAPKPKPALPKAASTAIDAAERQARMAETEALDAHLEQQPEIRDEARVLARQRAPRGRNGSKAFEAIVTEIARDLARRALDG